MIATPESVSLDAPIKGRRLVSRLKYVLFVVAALMLLGGGLEYLIGGFSESPLESFMGALFLAGVAIGLERGSRIARWIMCLSFVLNLFVLRLELLQHLVQNPGSFEGVLAGAIVVLDAWGIYVLLLNRNVDAFFREARRKAWMTA